MGMRAKLISEYRKNHSAKETILFAATILGLDSFTGEDGGPGSGNWGHKGRPGKIGGSGKGGGKQYRGGRSDIAYMGSREDWLNGLQGEKQHKAHRMVSENRQDLSAKLAAKNKFTDMWKSGMLSKEEAEERIKQANLENVNEGMSTEEYIMRNGKPQEKADLVQMMKEARSWDETKNRMIDENLSEDEKTILEAIEKNTETLPLDSRDQAEEIKELLEAKAMGAFETDIDVPDELQYAIGTKERPAPPAPPEPEGPDYSWYEPTSYGIMEQFMADITGARVSYGHKFTLEEFTELNRKFVDSVKYGKLSPNQVSYYGVSAVELMRQRMGLSLSDKPSAEMANRLTDEEKKTILDTVNRFNDLGSFYSEPVESFDDLTYKDMKAAESKMQRLNMNRYRSAEALKPFKDYILAQEKMLTGIEPTDHDVIKEAENKAKAEKARLEAEKQAKKESERKQKAEAWKATHTPEQIKKMHNPDTVAGVSRMPSGDMDHEQADSGKVNPLRTMNTPESMRGNCQTCVMAYALRRRGYDVVAKLRKGDAEEKQYELAQSQAHGWLDPETGEELEPVVPKKNLTKKTARKWLDENVKDGEMHTFSFCWKKYPGGHVIIIEKQNGQLRLYDPQPDPTIEKVEYTGEEIERYLEDVSLNGDAARRWRPKLLRVDNALPKPEYYDTVLQKA